MRQVPEFRALSQAAVGGFAIIDLAMESLPVISLAAGSVIGGIIGTTAGYGVFGATFVLVADRVYQNSLPEEARGYVLDVLFASVALGFMLLLSPVVAGSQYIAFFAFILVSATLFAVYAHVAGPKTLTDATDPLIQPVQRISVWTDVREEIERDLSRQGWRRYVGIAAFGGATGMILMFPAVVAGAVGMFLAQAYPLPDLLAILWVGGRVAPDAQTERIKARLPNFTTQAELDIQLLTTTRNAVRSPLGMVLMLVTAGGAFGAAGVVFMGITMANSWVQLYSTNGGILMVVQTLPMLSWAVLGGVLTTLTAGGMLLWAWIREFRRIPAYLDAKEPAKSKSTPPVRRMTLALLVLPVQFPLGILFIGYFATIESPLLPIFGLVWPLWLAGILATGYHGLRYGAIDTAGTRTVIVAGAVGVLAGVVVGPWVASQLAINLPGPTPTSLRTQPFGPHPISLIPITVVLILVATLPDIWRADKHRQTELLIPAFFVFLGGISLVGRRFTNAGQTRTGLLMLGIFAIVAGCLVAVVRVFE